MRKLPAKLLSLVTMGVLSVSNLFTFAQTDFQNPDPTFNPTVPGGSTSGLAQNGLLTTITIVINRALGLMALVALVILLFGGFQMVTAAGDDAKYKKGFKILQQAAIGLIFIGASWLIVSLIFFVIGKFTA